VHHIDRNRNNNDPSNLEILCPTCHEEEHYLNGDGVYHNNKVVEPVGVQPTTYRLQSGCSRIEL
jgi:5-methylcytosine-specific restriction endonuclease McrA